MRHSRHGRESAGASEINLTPLLDLVFQLIMFFMITVNFVQAESFSEDVVLPKAKHAEALDRSAADFVFLNLKKDGKLAGYHEEDLNNDQRLRAHLQREHNERDRIAREKGMPGAVIFIVLRAHKDVPWGEEWRILDVCAKAGYDRWQMRVLVQK
jgi:biopolymer transport protein ExbD